MSEHKTINGSNHISTHPVIDNDIPQATREERKARLMTKRYVDPSPDLKHKILAYAFAGALFLGGVYYLQSQIREYGANIIENYAERLIKGYSE